MKEEEEVAIMQTMLTTTCSFPRALRHDAVHRHSLTPRGEKHTEKNQLKNHLISTGTNHKTAPHSTIVLFRHLGKQRKPTGALALFFLHNR